MPTETNYGSCECCTVSSSSGSTGSTGSSGGTVQTTCCEAPVPETLNVTLTNLSGCPALDGLTASLTYITTSGYWVFEALCNGEVVTFYLTCITGTWSIPSMSICGESSLAATKVSDSCSPFELVFDWSNFLSGACGCCTGSVSVRITITD